MEKEMIKYEDFAKLDIRTGKIVSAEKIEGTAKLVKIDVDIGTEVRQIVAGIGEAYDEKELKDKSIIVLTNLEPKSLKGVMSNGMLLAASVDNMPVLLTPEKDVPVGTEVK